MLADECYSNIIFGDDEELSRGFQMNNYEASNTNLRAKLVRVGFLLGESGCLFITIQLMLSQTVNLHF